LAGSLTVFLMAQAGIPFTTGFLAKLEVISASVGGRSTALAVIAMVSAAIAAFFYLRVILLMYSGTAAYQSDASDTASPLDVDGGLVPPGFISLTASSLPASSGSAGSTGEPAGSASADPGAMLTLVEGAGAEASPVSGATAAAIAVCVAVTVLFGLWPAPVVNFAHHATLLFR
jgi:NADH-quinone oxidoreductase subunit N